MDNNEIALFAFERALNFNQWSIPALTAIAKILKAEDKFAEAVEYIHRSLKVDATNGASWSELGTIRSLSTSDLCLLQA